MDNYTAHAQAAISALQAAGLSDHRRTDPTMLIAAAQVETILALAAAVASLAPVPGSRPA
ncbi:hypothetical protein ACEZCY_12455 [Streptacidiphilus sp. N1-12]|uniref:Uncharacterized protein n=2 Tax=Streptacidiphilus alkalitolerans TaxID=3342712 RepID=A0ABV6WDD6_9ACTN